MIESVDGGGTDAASPFSFGGGISDSVTVSLQTDSWDGICQRVNVERRANEEEEEEEDDDDTLLLLVDSSAAMSK